MPRVSHRRRSSFAALFGSAALAASTSAPAKSIGDSWPILAANRAGDCALTIASAGHAMQLRASGLIPGEAVRFVLTNGDMKPIIYTAFADTDGGLMRYYLPFRFGRAGGTVQVGIAAARCTVSSAAQWSRELVTIR